MSNRVECPHCQGGVKVPPGQEGQRCVCPRCSEAFTIPGGEPAPQPGSAGTAGDGGFDLSLEPLSPSAPPAPSASSTSNTPPPPPPAGQANAPASQGESELPPLGDLAPDEPPAERAPRRPRQPAADSRAGQSVDPMMLTNPPPAPVAAPVGQAQRYFIKCEVCGSALQVEREQIGQEVKCDDCFSLVTVTEPPKPEEKKSQLPPQDEVETFAFKDEGIGASPLANNPGVPSLEETLKKAEKALDEEEKELENEFVDVDWGQVAGQLSVVRFMGHSNVWPRWIFFSAGMMGVMVLATYAHQKWQVPGATGVGAVGLGIVALGALAFWMLCATPVLNTIMHSASAGKDRIEEWPTGGFFEYTGEFLQIMLSVCVAGFPGMLVATFVESTPVAAFFVVVSMTALHPIVFFSMLQNNSMTGFYSSEVMESFKEVPSAWRYFYAWSCGLSLAAWASAVTAIFSNLLAVGVISFILVLIFFIYFRLLGTLALQCMDSFRTNATSEG